MRESECESECERRRPVRAGGLEGQFSFIEHNSGVGSVSLLVASRFPLATVVSVEGDARLSDVHLARALRLNITNNLVCGTAPDASLARKLFKSPEFVRFQVVSGEFGDLLGRLGAADYGDMVGHLFGVAMSTFLSLPPARLLSLAFTTLFYTYPDTTVHSPSSLVRGAVFDGPAWGSERDWRGGDVGDSVALRGLGGDGATLSALSTAFALAAHPR